jgi:hypothetical protein
MKRKLRMEAEAHGTYLCPFLMAVHFLLLHGCLGNGLPARSCALALRCHVFSRRLND